MSLRELSSLQQVTEALSFGYKVANYLYILSLYVYSHRMRCNRQGYGILEFLIDPTLANDLVKLQNELKDDIDFERFLTAIKCWHRLSLMITLAD
jgi:hypothetical protein